MIQMLCLSGSNVNAARTHIVIGVARRASQERVNSHAGVGRSTSHSQLRYLCGKRLVPAIRCGLRFLDEEEFLHVSHPVKKALTRLSPATLDRLLKT